MKYTLENLKVENPCPISWEQMTGTDEVRHCETCWHKVYNISAMPKRRALKVLNQSKSSVCVTYYLDDRNQVVTQSYFGVFKRNFAKAVGALLAIIFSLNSLHAMQTKTVKPKKKKVVKHRNYKKQIKPPPSGVVGLPGTAKNRLTGILQ